MLHGILVLALLFLVGCGGGSGTLQMSMPTMPEPPITEPNSVSVTYDNETGNPTSERLLSYLRTHAGGGPWPSGPNTYTGYTGIARFPIAPTVRIARGTSDHTRALIHHAVALINRELPYEWHVQMGSDTPPLAAIESVPDNQIFIDFAPSSDWNDPNYDPTHPSAAITQSRGHGEYDSEQERWETNLKHAAHVWVSSELDFGSDAGVLSVLIHELLHALGLSGHVEVDTYPDSIMAQRQTTGRVPEIDGAALRIIYTRYDTGTEPEDISVASLGEWETTETNLTGEIGAVSFGVSSRNSVRVPWTSGPIPSTPLADNGAIRGTATWNGELLGFTPTKQSVGGNAEISVDLEIMTGRADFTDLQSWSADQAPGALGTGTMWGDGDLGYTISISGNYLRSTDGDDGAVAGSFYGSGHEEVAGSLERSDLTAAFGAKRP